MVQSKSKTALAAEKQNKALAAAKKRYQAPGSQTSYAQQKRNAWNNYRAYFEPAMTKYRQNIFNAVLDLGRGNEKDIKKIIKKISKLSDDYVTGCLDAMGEYLITFTTAHTSETLDNRGIDIAKMLEIANEYEKTKNIPKPKRQILDRKDVKVRSKVNQVTKNPKKRRGKKV